MATSSITSTVTASLLLCGLAACSTAPAPAPAAAAIPSALQPAAGETRAFVWHARGVQIYACTLAAGAAAPAWTFVAPEAELFESAAATTAVGSHGAGPFWQALDGSRVLGQVQARADAPRAGAIPWLLLNTSSSGGPGRLAKVTSIQRINTTAGVAPATGCTGAAEVGQRARVPYTSDYVFFSKGG